MAGSTEIVFAHTVIALIDKVRELIRHDIGIYGPSMSGKTTLDKQLTTPGMIRPLQDEDRTHHKKMFLSEKYRMPPESAKRIISEGGLKKTVVSRDIGGHTQYQNMWLRDMYIRKIKTVVVVIDHRHLLDPDNTDNQIALGYLVESLKRKSKPKGLGLIKSFTRRKYRPERLILLANKADEWLDDEAFEMFDSGMIANHPVFDAFRHHLFALQEMAIPVHIDAISATKNFNVQQALMKGMGFR